jgi:hypothetical protein
VSATEPDVATETDVAEVVTLAPGADYDDAAALANETLSVQIGGSSYQVVGDTNLATTLANFVTLHKAAVEALLGGTATLTVNPGGTALLLTGAATGSDITLGGTAVVDADFTVTNTAGAAGTGTVTTDGVAETVTDNEASAFGVTETAATAAGATDTQQLTLTVDALGSAAVTAGGQTSDELTGGAGSDTFNFASGDSTATAMDVITDFETGDATIDFDTLNLGSTDVLADVLLANQIDVSQNSEDATPATDIGAIVQDGIITVVGADAAEIDTLDEWSDVVLQVLTAQGGNQVAAFEFEGSTYVVEENANVIELADTVGIVGISTTEDTDVIHLM